MSENSRVIEVLKEIRPECDFQGSENFIADGLLDSFDLVMLVPSLEQAFSIQIPGEWIVAEHFISTAAIVNLIEKCRS